MPSGGSRVRAHLLLICPGPLRATAPHRYFFLFSQILHHRALSAQCCSCYSICTGHSCKYVCENIVYLHCILVISIETKTLHSCVIISSQKTKLHWLDFEAHSSDFMLLLCSMLRVKLCHAVFMKPACSPSCNSTHFTLMQYPFLQSVFWVCSAAQSYSHLWYSKFAHQHHCRFHFD